MLNGLELILIIELIMTLTRAYSVKYYGQRLGEVNLRENERKVLVVVWAHRSKIYAAMAILVGNWKYGPAASIKQQVFRDLSEAQWNLNT